jgi:hypothetical protein
VQLHFGQRLAGPEMKIMCNIISLVDGGTYLRKTATYAYREDRQRRCSLHHRHNASLNDAASA